jgi:hypothetical protein
MGSPRDEVIFQNVLSSSSWSNISLELKVWWWFKREILESEQRRQRKESYRWDLVNSDVEIPTMDGRHKLQRALWSQWWDICKDYEIQTNQSDHFCVEWDVDEDGVVHGILLVMKHDASYATIRRYTPCMVEYFNEKEFSALSEAKIGSLFQHCEKVEGDTLAYFYGPGSLLQHRCNYGVKFGSSKSTRALIGITCKQKHMHYNLRMTSNHDVQTWRLKTKRLGDNVKKDFKRGEILSVCYSRRRPLGNRCRCVVCRSRKKSKTKIAQSKSVKLQI